MPGGEVVSMTVQYIPGHDVPAILTSLEASVQDYLSTISLARAKPASVPLSQHRDAFTISVAHSLLLSGCTASKRDLYYMAKDLFGTQANADAALRRVAADVPTHRNNLNILPAPKGLVAGNLSWVSESGNQIQVAMFGSSGIPIPPRPERFLSVSTGAPFVLVIEKETAFASLGAFPGFLEDSKCILLTGKGYPDYASRLLLTEIVNSRLPDAIPVVVLVDADPHGLHIALTYAACIPEECFRYIGVRPSERVSPLGLHDAVLLPVAESERVLAENLVATVSTAQNPLAPGKCNVEAIVSELQYVLATMVKFEIEALVTLQMSPSSLVGYIKAEILRISED